MITCSLRGNLGNQMFIAATVIAHALRMDTNYAFPPRSGKRDQFPFMFTELPMMMGNRELDDSANVYRESRFGI